MIIITIIINYSKDTSYYYENHNGIVFSSSCNFLAILVMLITLTITITITIIDNYNVFMMIMTIIVVVIIRNLIFCSNRYIVRKSIFFEHFENFIRCVFQAIAMKNGQER